MKGVIGTGVSGSKGEGPGTVNIQREPLLSAVNIFKYYLRVGHERYGGERNDRKGERKDRETPRGKENGGRAWEYVLSTECHSTENLYILAPSEAPS